MTFDKAKRKEYFNLLKMPPPLDYGNPIDQEKYVVGLHGDSDYVDALFQAIDLQEDQGVFLFSGQRGSGKSTELKRLKYRLEQESESTCKVYYLDMSSWLNYNRNLELGSFLIAVVAAWVEQTTSVTGVRSPAQRFWEFLTNINISTGDLKVGADLGLIKIELQEKLRNEETFLAAVEKSINAGRNSFVSQAKKLIEELVDEVCPNGEKCVLLIDSLEKISGQGDNSAAVLASVLNLFSNQSDALQLPFLHVVYSIPPYVLEHNKNLPAHLGGAVAVQLPSVHVFEKNSSKPSWGVDKLIDLVGKRCPDWALYFEENDLRQLAADSGGDLRDYLRALQNCLLKVNEKTPRVDAKALEFARSQICPTLVIPKEHMVWMSRIDQSHKPEINESLDALLFEKYLNTKHILAYLNGHTWYGLHPLIRDEVLQQAGTHAQDDHA